MTTGNLSIQDNDTVVQYTAVGESQFVFPFPILETDELKVSRNQAVLTFGVDYSISGLGDEGGGFITLLLGASTPGDLWTLWQDMPIERLTGFSAGAAVILGSALNAEFVGRLRVEQQLRREIRNSVRIPPDDPVSSQDMVLPTKALRAGKYFAFDANGKPITSAGTGNDSALRTDLAVSLSATAGAKLIGTRRPEAGAVATTVFEVLSRTVHVADFGAVGDDATDNATPLANAIACVLNGDTLEFGNGTYRFSSLPGLSTGVNVRGRGMWKTVLKYTGGAASIIKMANLASANSYINIEDLAVQPNNAGDICIDFKSVSSGTIERVRIEGGTTFASRKATGIRWSAASSSCYQNMVINCFLQYLTECLAVEDGANENRVIGGAFLSSGVGIKTRGTLSDSLRVQMVRFENNADAVNIHDFRDYLFIGNRFEKNANGTRGIVVIGGNATFAPLTLINNHYSSYAAGNDLVFAGITGRIRRFCEDNLEYDDFTGAGSRHLGTVKIYVGNPGSGTDPEIAAEGLNANHNLILTPKGTGLVQAGAGAAGAFIGGRLLLLDGVAAPATLGGAAQIYVDAADGDLKVKFGDGTVKTIVVDT